ncbi:MAG: hypothetical protein L6247_02240 [Desulfobacteraceae bacterium]|nr:hypothetical protein [Desulfobacteraceae bacterium]
MPDKNQGLCNLRNRLRSERLGITRKRSLADLVAKVSATLAVFGSFCFIAYRTVQGTITLGDMVMYFGAFQRGLGYLKEMLGGLADLYENNLLRLESQVETHFIFCLLYSVFLLPC